METTESVTTPDTADPLTRADALALASAIDVLDRFDTFTCSGCSRTKGHAAAAKTTLQHFLIAVEVYDESENAAAVR